MKTFKQHLQEKQNTGEIHVFDIDDALFFTSSKIYYTLPGETEERSVSTSEFAKIRQKLPKDTKFDFREFREFKSIYAGLVGGTPNISVLQKLDKAVNAGHKIGILTARGNQSAVLAGIKDALLFKDKKGQLKKIPRDQFRKRWVFAVSDANTERALKKMGAKGKGALSPEDLKAFVLQDILIGKEGFKNVVFYDDDKKNVKAVNDLNNPKIKAIKV